MSVLDLGIVAMVTAGIYPTGVRCAAAMGAVPGNAVGDPGLAPFHWAVLLIGCLSVAAAVAVVGRYTRPR